MIYNSWYQQKITYYDNTGLAISRAMNKVDTEACHNSIEPAKDINGHRGIILVIDSLCDIDATINQ